MGLGRGLQSSSLAWPAHVGRRASFPGIHTGHTQACAGGQAVRRPPFTVASSLSTALATARVQASGPGPAPPEPVQCDVAPRSTVRGTRVGWGRGGVCSGRGKVALSAQDPATCLPQPLVMAGARRPACWCSSGRSEGKPTAWSKKVRGSLSSGSGPPPGISALCQVGGGHSTPRKTPKQSQRKGNLCRRVLLGRGLAVDTH